MTVIAYHFTSANGWAQIQYEGLIRAGQSHVHPRRPAIGGAVVHLTTDSTGEVLGIKAPKWMEELSDFDIMDRKRIRITVGLEKRAVPRFIDYCRKHNAPPTWVPWLQKEHGSIGRWRVHPGDIPRSAWLACHDMRTGRPLKLDRPQIEPEEDLGAEYIEKQRSPLSEEQKEQALAFLQRTKNVGQGTAQPATEGETSEAVR